MLTRRRLLVVSAAALVGATRVARGEDWPQRPIRIIVPFGPGGGSDIIGRIVGQSLQEKLGQPVVIENRPGAAGTLGNEAVARADKDGYTLGIMTAGQIIAAVMNKSLRYDTLTDRKSTRLNSSHSSISYAVFCLKKKKKKKK